MWNICVVEGTSDTVCEMRAIAGKQQQNQSVYLKMLGNPRSNLLPLQQTMIRPCCKNSWRSKDGNRITPGLTAVQISAIKCYVKGGFDEVWGVLLLSLTKAQRHHA